MASGTELAKAYVQIVPSAQGIRGKITEVLSGEASSAGNSAGKSIMSGIKSAIATAGIGTAIKAAISEGADLQQNIGGIETLFGDSAGKMKQYAAEAYKTAGLSANAYMETVTSFSASLLQSLDKDTEAAAEAANSALIDMSDNANKMGTSMELIQNAYQGFSKQNYTMLDNLKLGYGGTKTEMQRLLADAQKLSGVEYNIDNLADVYEAIHVIQEDLGITGTTAKEAATTLTGSLASMKSAFSNLIGNLAIGEDIRPALNALGDTVFTFIKGNLFPMIGNVLKGLPDILSGLGSMIIRGLNLAADGADELVQMGMDLVSQLVVGIFEQLPYVAESALSLITSLSEALLNTDWVALAQNLIGELRNNIELASAEIMGTDGSIVDAVLQSITQKLPEVLSGGVEIITNLANGLMSNLPLVISSVGEIVGKFINFIIENLPTVLQTGATVISNLVQGFISNLPEVISSIAKIIAELLAEIGAKLPDILQSGIEIIGELAAGLIKAIPDVVAAIPEIIAGIVDAFLGYDWVSIGNNIIDGIGNGIKNFAGNIASAAKEAARGALDAAKAALGIHSPSRVFETEVGKMIDMGLAAGIEKNIDTVSDSMKELSAATVGMVDTDFSVNGGISKYKSLEQSEVSLQTLYALLVAYLPALANMRVVLDSGAVVGELAPEMNEELGRIAAREDRQ